MNNPIGRTITLSGTYAPLATTRTVASFTLTALSTNSAVAYLKGDNGDDVPIQPGEWHQFKSVALSQIEVKGTAGDQLTVIGGTW